MKINWGTGIVIAMVAFICFILYFVIKMTSGKEYDYDLVTEKYYQQELTYQNQIDASQNTIDDNKKIAIQKTKEGLQLRFPKNLDYKKIEGNVFLYRPSNKILDFEMPISISDSNFVVPKKRLLEGRWNVIVTWQYNNKKYRYKQELTY